MPSMSVRYSRTVTGRPAAFSEWKKWVNIVAHITCDGRFAPLPLSPCGRGCRANEVSEAGEGYNNRAPALYPSPDRSLSLAITPLPQGEREKERLRRLRHLIQNPHQFLWRRHMRRVRGVDLVHFPSLAARALHERPEVIAGEMLLRVDESARECERPVFEVKLLLVGFDRLRRAARGEPRLVFRRSVRRHAARRHFPAVEETLQLTLAPLRRRIVMRRLPLLRHIGVEIDEMLDTIPRAVGDAGRDHAAVGVADEDHVAQVFVK